MKLRKIEMAPTADERREQAIASRAHALSLSLNDADVLSDKTNPTYWTWVDKAARSSLKQPHVEMVELIRFHDRANRADLGLWEHPKFTPAISAPIVLSIRVPEPEPRTDEDIEEVFNALAEEWHRETETTSSFTDIILHSAYQKIIGLGSPAVPLLLRELELRPAHWFWALAHITRENPIRDEDAGRLEGMTEAWLEWGRQRSYL